MDNTRQEQLKADAEAARKEAEKQAADQSQQQQPKTDQSGQAGIKRA